jgi:DNA polymerase
VEQDELRAEAAALLGATRALIEFHRSTGATGFPQSAPDLWPPQVDDLLDVPVFTASPGLAPPSLALDAPDTVRMPEPPFGITGLPPEVEPGPASFTEAPPAVIEAPAEEAPALPPVELAPEAVPMAPVAPVALVAPAPPPAPPSPLFEDEPTQGFLFAPSEIPDTPLPAPARELAGLPPPRTAEAHRRLELLARQIQGCTGCVLHQQRKRTVFARGNPDAELCFIGEAPGADEDDQGLPFVGRAGQLLDRMIGAMGLTQDEVYITNICRCRPPANRTPTPEEMGACLPYLHEQLLLSQPRVIVALGATATKGLLRTALGIKGLRGTWKLYRHGPLVVPVMPTYHPAYLLRETEAGRLDAKRDVWKDLQAVLERLGRPIPSRGKK